MKQDFKRSTILVIITAMIGFTVSIMGLKLQIDYLKLEQEKESLEIIIQTQKSMIADLEEEKIRLSEMVGGIRK